MCVVSLHLAPVRVPVGVAIREGVRTGGAGSVVLAAPGAVVLCAVVLCAVVLCAVAGCSSGTPDSPADKSFISQVHLAAPDVATYRSDIELSRLGHAACDGFRSGASYLEVADRMNLLQGSNPLPSQDLGAVISAAADNYCPQYRSKAF